MTTGTDLVPVSDYRALAPSGDALDLIKENLQGQEVTEFDLPRIKIPSGGGGTWEVPTLQGTEGVKELQGIIVHSKQTRSYWAEPYEGGNEPPDCSSPDADFATKSQDFEGDIPADVTDSGLYVCETCQFAAYGSSDTGSGRGQACKLSRMLFMIVPDRMLPMVVVLPPTSLKPAKQYFLGLADFGIRRHGIVTRIGLEKVSKKGVPDFSQAVFLAGDKLDEETQERAQKYGEVLAPLFERARVEDQSEVTGDAGE